MAYIMYGKIKDGQTYIVLYMSSPKGYGADVGQLK